ncbi:uncharacterized protein si:dkey-273o13.3 [Thalassophryne amazonica]|uniref:uncharacterized protein si:dkey-273o13.3 n=1 Tax=Thalassophryne amazonica TaxID=390379 RepID=UPI0014723F6B|nr:uncharacterized protein si:dkey-273o13.3 [Thalassophryne amazonica]
MMLQEPNEGLHQTLLKTAGRMESLREEFVSSQKLLEVELQRTCMELSNLTEKFKILHDNCSSTQQTNNLLEQKLHSAVQDMEDERRRLNLRILALTKHLTHIKSVPSLQTVHGTTMANKANECLQSDDVPRGALPLTPPPAQFMDTQNCGEPKAAGQEESLGSVPEEEESDWSEMGEELPRFIQSETHRSQVWRHQGGGDREAWCEEMVRGHASRHWQVPHLQFTIHSEILSVPQSENLCDNTTGKGPYRITTGPNLSSAILIRSASLEELPLARMQKELRGTEAVMDLRRPADETAEDDQRLMQHWSVSGGRNVTGSRVAETESSAEVLLSHFLREPRPSGVKGHGSHQAYGWMEEVLQRERTQL